MTWASPSSPASGSSPRWPRTWGWPRRGLTLSSDVDRILQRAVERRPADVRRRRRPAPLARPARDRPRRRRGLPAAPSRAVPDVQHRPEHQLHQRLRRRLRLLRLLPQGRRTPTLTSSTVTVLLDKIRETVELGGDQILMQGGLHPDLPFEWYEELLRDIKAHYPSVNIHGFSPPELHFFAKKFRMPIEAVLSRLKDAGLGSLPGGGGEILVDRVRKAMTRGKVLSDDWINVHRAWHRLGGVSTATMMFGHIETLEERVEHFERVRSAPGRDRRPDRLHLLDLPARAHRHGRRPARGGVRVLEDPGRLAALPRQRAEHPVVVGDAGPEDRPARALLRRQRHGQPDDRGERRRLGRDGLLPVAERRSSGRSARPAMCPGSGTSATS